MINAEVVRNWEFPELTKTYSEGDAILFALSLGYGSDPVDEAQLEFVFERDLRVVPAFVNVLCHPGFWIADPRTGIDASRAVHGEHRVAFHEPLPTHGTVRSATKVLDVVDKGAGKGALVVSERLLFDRVSGRRLASIEQHTLCRGDGGFSDEVKLAPSSLGSAVGVVPERGPDEVVEIASLPQAALLYRLSADLNPLHVDPATARRAGFPRPILHGLCTYGIACRALLQACAENDSGRLKSLAGRFSAPVFPGETIRTEIWYDNSQGDTQSVRFRCLVPQRATTVFSSGSATIR